MRELRFRAWNTDDLEMCNSIALSEDGWANTSCGKDKPHWPVMQFTGLKDKNGVDIYEGDVVKGGRPIKDRSGRTIGKERLIGAVEYDAWWGGFRRVGVKQYQGITAELNNIYQVVVLGNIYEHPELLEAQCPAKKPISAPATCTTTRGGAASATTG